MDSVNVIPFIVFSIILGVFAAGLHLMSVFLSGRISKISYYLNLGVHLLLFIAMFFAGASMDVLVLSFMLSVFFYVGAYFIRYTLVRRENNRESFGEGGDENDL